MAETTLMAEMSTQEKMQGKPRANAETMAKKQREIAVSEFFAKNRHLLGFDNPSKALLTTVKEAVDNALDACEEAGILPFLYIGLFQISETRFKVTVRDNGPGIVRAQIENVFGKLLYGSKFHRLKMSRGQQGIGISAAGMYGLMTTGKPVIIHSKPKKNKPAHHVELAIDTQKNKAEVTVDREMGMDEFPNPTGTEVTIELEGKYMRGKRSVDEYLEQTAIANPHVCIIYRPPSIDKAADETGGAAPTQDGLIDDYQHALKLASTAKTTVTTPGGHVVYPRTVDELPDEPAEIKPHPRGIELGTLIKMMKESELPSLSSFFSESFCRCPPKLIQELTEKAGLTTRTKLRDVDHSAAEKLYAAIQETRFQSPPTNCLSAIGTRQILAGLLKGVKAEFYTAVTRSPEVYRGNPFQVEVGLAFGGELPSDDSARVIRFANRVPLQYQQSACATFKSVVDTGWRNYGLSQPRGSLPDGPMIIMIHLASVWVPFTSESKEAIADYDEICKEIKLALSEAGRKLKTYLGRRQRMRRESERRGIFERYIGEVVLAIARIDNDADPVALKERFEEVAKRFTEAADLEFDEDGNPIRKSQGPFNGTLERDDDVIILDQNANPDGDEAEAESSAAGSNDKASAADGDEDQQNLFE